MYLDENAFKVNNISMGQYVTQVEFGRNKLWANDTGRNLKGKTTGTFLGVVNKFKLSFRALSREELEIISPILDSAWQNVTYYDPSSHQNETIRTYTGDWQTLNKNIFTNVATANESFEISFIAVEPKVY